ncbi:MAG: VOC family protein [Anaerolineales bacterium]|nr:VOC family protein [Anaerolineales bacterium]
MILNHLNLAVSDVEAAADFLSTYFGMTRQGGNRGMAFLSDDNGLLLSLSKTKGPVKYPGVFHIGFGQPDRATVDAIHQRLKADGFELEPPMDAHAYTFYIEAPGGFTVEVLS